MAGYKWTPDELAAVAEPDCTFAAFEARFPGQRTWTAFRFKRDELGLPARRGDPESNYKEKIDSSPSMYSAPPNDPAGGTTPPSPEITGVTAGERPDIDAIRQRAEAQYAAVAKTHERRKHQHLHFTHAPLCLVVCADQHFGAPGVDIRRIFEEQQAIMRTPGTYVLLGGDTVDNMIVGRLMSQQMFTSTTQEESWALAEDYVRRFEDRIVGAVSGNHTQWTTKMLGVDYDRQIVRDAALYDTDDLLVTVHAGPHELLLRLRHKWSGNSIYNPTHGIERAARFDSSRPDVYIGCHVHKGAMAREFVLDARRKLAMLAGTYKMVDSYARTEGFPANDASTAVALVIHADGSYFGTGNLYAALNYMRAIYRGAA